MPRYQRGYVYQTGNKVKMWYGRFREDIPKPDGRIERKNHNLRLGTLAELPTKNAARQKLADLLKDSAPSMDMYLQELIDRWEKAEGPTMKATTLSHYRNALRAYVVPVFGKRKIATINREDLQIFLAQQSARYSPSALRSMRVVLSLTLGWAVQCGWLERNPCSGMRLPQQAAGKRVTRTVLTPEQVIAISQKLREPYATLVLFLATTGLRVGEATAVKWSDFDDNVLHVTRRIYDGDEDTVKSRRSIRKLPIAPELIERMRRLGTGEWVFRSRRGTPINPGNVLKRYVRPVAAELGITIGGWHDFRHTLTTQMRRAGVHPVVISGILGHAKVDLAMNVYDRVDVDDLRQPLADVSEKLFRDVPKSQVAGLHLLKTKGMVSAVGIEPTTY